MYNQGWLPAGELKIGDLLVCEAGDPLPVEDLLDTGDYETVYNLRVAEHHTYFVGGEAWGFGVWAHNTCFEVGLFDELAEEARLHRLGFYSSSEPFSDASARTGV